MGCCFALNKEGYAASLERHKIYRVLADQEAEKDGDIRIIDEIGEDYLYPKDWFVLITVPDAAEVSLLRTAREIGGAPRFPIFRNSSFVFNHFAEFEKSRYYIR